MANLDNDYNDVDDDQHLHENDDVDFAQVEQEVLVC